MKTFESLLDKTEKEILVYNFGKKIRGKYYGKLDEFEIFFDTRYDNIIHLDRIVVQTGFRKMGIGSKIMQEVCDFADKHGFTITLSVADKNTDIGTTSKGRLYKFYRRFGFTRNFRSKKKYHLSIYTSMYREPR